MLTIDDLIAPIIHSPQLPVIVQRLQNQLEEENRRRQEFYDEVSPDQKAEFIDGEMIVHSPARNRHLDVTQFVARLLITFAQIHGLGQVKVEKCLCVFSRNAYEPDVVFFGSQKAQQLTAETKLFPIPDLIVEVLSESTAANDRGIKFQDYASSGVQEYWIMDADQNVVEQYVLAGEQYQLVLKSDSGVLKSHAIAGFVTDVEGLFGAEKNLEMLRKMMAAAG
jgi:Uma2 family endonuclease